MRIVAIDQGTTSTRAFVVSGRRDGPQVEGIVARRAHKQYYPQKGWVEHDPEEILLQIGECLDAAGSVDAVGLANQGESCLAWDRETGRAISPIIVWQDRRTHEELERLKAKGVTALVAEHAGLPLDCYFSASKLGWIIRHIPEAKSLLWRGRLCLGTSDAFFLHRLTGRYATDVSTASRTSLMNLQSRTWDKDLCERFGVPIEALPPIVPTTGDFGAVSIGGKNVPLKVSVVDQQAALFGHGCRAAGEAKFTFGSGAFMLAVSGEIPPRSDDCKLVHSIAWELEGQQPAYAVEGGVFCAGSAINWARSLGLFDAFNALNNFERSSAIGRGLVFVPALSGLGCPYWDRNAAGAWFGLSLETTSQDMMQAVLEGIALRAAQVVDAVAREIELGDYISIDGGLSANPYFAQFFADVSQKTIQVSETGELTSLGVVQLAFGDASLSFKPSKKEKIYRPGRDLTSGKDLFEKAVAGTIALTG